MKSWSKESKTPFPNSGTVNKVENEKSLQNDQIENNENQDL